MHETGVGCVVERVQRGVLGVTPCHRPGLLPLFVVDFRPVLICSPGSAQVAHLALGVTVLPILSNVLGVKRMASSVSFFQS